VLFRIIFLKTCLCLFLAPIGPQFLTSRFICAPSLLNGVNTPRTKSESLSHGTFALRVIFLIISFPGAGAIVVGTVGGIGASMVMPASVAISSLFLCFFLFPF